MACGQRGRRPERGDGAGLCHGRGADPAGRRGPAREPEGRLACRTIRAGPVACPGCGRVSAAGALLRAAGLEDLGSGNQVPCAGAGNPAAAMAAGPDLFRDRHRGGRGIVGAGPERRARHGRGTTRERHATDHVRGMADRRGLHGRPDHDHGLGDYGFRGPGVIGANPTRCVRPDGVRLPVARCVPADPAGAGLWVDRAGWHGALQRVEVLGQRAGHRRGRVPDQRPGRDAAAVPDDGQLCGRGGHFGRNLPTGACAAGAGARRAGLCHGCGLCGVRRGQRVVHRHRRDFWPDRPAADEGSRLCALLRQRDRRGRGHLGGAFSTVRRNHPLRPAHRTIHRHSLRRGHGARPSGAAALFRRDLGGRPAQRRSRR